MKMLKTATIAMMYTLAGTALATIALLMWVNLLNRDLGLIDLTLGDLMDPSMIWALPPLAGLATGAVLGPTSALIARKTKLWDATVLVAMSTTTVVLAALMLFAALWLITWTAGIANPEFLGADGAWHKPTQVAIVIATTAWGATCFAINIMIIWSTFRNAGRDAGAGTPAPACPETT